MLLPLGVISANMGGKLLVPLQLEVVHHFIERRAGGPTGGFEAPATFGTGKTLKTLLFNPYQLPAHDRLCRCAPTSTRALSRNKTFWFAINRFLRGCVLPDYSGKPSQSGHGGRCIKDERSLHASIWMVCRASYIDGRRLFWRTPISGPRCEAADHLR